MPDDTTNPVMPASDVTPASAAESHPDSVSRDTRPEAIRFAQDLRRQTAAVRLRHRKFGVRKALSEEQRHEAAEVFSADAEQLSASKKLLNTKHDAYAAVLAIRRAATDYWRLSTVAYPEEGVRLIRRDKIEAFNTRMLEYRSELAAAVSELDKVYDDLRESARQNLGDLFNDADYPASLAGHFGIYWDYPAIEAPKYLQKLNPALYEQEQSRISARFQEAMRMTEEALAAELQELIGHLCDRLTGTAGEGGTAGDGKPRQIRESSISNVQDFLQRFRELNVCGSEQLEQLVEQAQLAIQGIDVKGLRKDTALRVTLSDKMGEVKAALDKLVVERPKRVFRFDDDPGIEGEAA